MNRKALRSTDRPIPVKRTRPATPTVSDSSHLFQLRSLQPLSGMTCYEAEFVRTCVARPHSLSQGQVRTIAAIYAKHLGNGQQAIADPLEAELRPLSWQDELEYFETDGGVFEL